MFVHGYSTRYMSIYLLLYTTGPSTLHIPGLSTRKTGKTTLAHMRGNNNITTYCRLVAKVGNNK